MIVYGAIINRKYLPAYRMLLLTHTHNLGTLLMIVYGGIINRKYLPAFRIN